MTKKDKRNRKTYYVVRCNDCSFRKTVKTVSEAANEAEKHSFEKVHAVLFYRVEE